MAQQQLGDTGCDLHGVTSCRLAFGCQKLTLHGSPGSPDVDSPAPGLPGHCPAVSCVRGLSSFPSRHGGQGRMEELPQALSSRITCSALLCYVPRLSCGGRAPGTGATVPAAPSWLTGLSRAPAQPRTAPRLHPQVRATRRSPAARLGTGWLRPGPGGVPGCRGWRTRSPALGLPLLPKLLLAHTLCFASSAP